MTAIYWRACWQWNKILLLKTVVDINIFYQIDLSKETNLINNSLSLQYQIGCNLVSYKSHLNWLTCKTQIALVFKWSKIKTNEK